MSALIDTHAHITHHRFDDDREEMLLRALETGLETIVAIADTLDSCQAVIALASRNPAVVATAGIHPHHAGEWSPEAARILRGLLCDAESNRIVAVGEIGIDYHYDFATPEVQSDCFRAQIQLAKEFDLPIVVHCRESKDDILRHLEEEQDGRLRGVVHCFSEDLETARRILNLGFHLGVGGMVTFKHMEPLREVLREIGVEQVIVETDAPYLAPIPHRGKRNEPAFVAHTAAKIAEVLAMTPDEVAKVTTANARALFRLPQGT